MDQRRVAFETARLRLARYRLEGDESRARAAAHATRVSAEALQVERVGVWLFKDRNTRLLCASQYVRSSKQHGNGQELHASRYPSYVRALQERRVIAADDAHRHDDTRELTESYLIPNGITSILDAPIIHRGRVIGVVCHEHVGEPRAWTQKELGFASSVADMLTLVFEQAERLELEVALQDQTEQRLEQQKMEALGRMARAVAHDFNNLLGTIQLTLGLVAKSTPESLKKYVDDATAMIELGRRLTQQLLTFGKASEGTSETTVDVHALIERLSPVLRAALGSGVELVIESSAHQPSVHADPSQLEQVLLNLCLNARDAIDSVGRVAVTLRDAREDDDVAPDHLVLEVRDTGAGMNEATCARIFEPFFTTKSTGTGLGLATVYGIVSRAGGLVRATSTPGQGTTMFVALPRVVAT